MATTSTIPTPSQLRGSSPRLFPFITSLSDHHRSTLLPAKKCTGAADGRKVASLRCAATDTSEAAAEKKKKGSFDIQTLTTWLLKQEQAGTIDAELTIVLSSISMACKQIASLVQRSGISNLTGVQGAVNIQGEDQKKLDVISNEVFSNCLRSSGRTGIIASEEEDVPVAVEESYSGNYIVVFDPLDGSSNIDAAVSTGSIFGIYSPNDECLADFGDDNDANLDQAEQRCVVSVCQPGSNLLAAGYCMYSSSVIFVLTVGNGVYAFTLDPMYGEFVLTTERVTIPRAGKIYAFNEGNYMLWEAKLRGYMDSLKDPEANGGKPYSARYIGSLVGDFHRTLLYGGIYGYPRDTKSKNGKLRLLYECAPMSFIVEQAGGKGSDGHQRILDIKPEEAEKRPYQRPYRLKRSKHHLTPSSPPRSTPPPPRPTPPPVSLIADNTVMAGPGSGRRHRDRLQQQPDDAPGTSQHSSPGPQEASEQASTSGAKQKKRGPYMGFNLMRLIGAGGSGDGKVKIHFAPGTMKPAGGKADGSLPREIGLIARTEIPLHFKSWSKVTPPTRAQLMERVKAKFTSDAPPELFEKYCLETFKARFKEHRGELSKHFKKFASEEEARENPPPGVSIDDWVMLCTRFTAESFKALSTTNTGSRSKLRWNHLAGTKSFVAHRASLSAIPDAAGSSREIGEIELFQHTHMYPGGAWIAPEAEQSHASMLNMREQYQQTQAALEASGGESQPVSEAEICSQVVGDRYLQSLGQTRSRARSRRSSAQHDHALEDQVRALEQDLIREREERDWERERDRAENERRFADIEMMFAMAGGRPPVPGVGMPPQGGPPGGWAVGGMPQGGQPGGDPSGGYGYNYNMYPWVMPPRGPPGDQSSGGWRWTAPGDQGGGSS